MTRGSHTKLASLGKVVDLEEELDKVKNERQELVLQVQELQDDNDELNALVKKASGVGNKRMSVYGGGVKNEGSFDARRQSMAGSRMSIAPGGMGARYTLKEILVQESRGRRKRTYLPMHT